MAACSSDDKKTPDAREVDAAPDAETDAGVDAVPDAEADKQLPDAEPDKKPPPDAAPPCDPTIVGKSCDPADTNACSGTAPHRCVEVGDGVGFCSCTCRPDIAKTLVSSEDSCPSKKACYGEGDTSACGEVVANAPQHPNCGNSGQIAPDATDTMLRFAASLTPPSYPFWVTAVRYLLQAEVSACSIGGIHKVSVFVGTDKDAPVGSPSFLEEFVVPPASATTDPIWKIHALTSPIKLEQGQHLFVAVEVPVEGGKSACLQVCADQTGVGKRSFISINETELPYTWQSFADLQWPGELTLAAIGFEG